MVKTCQNDVNPLWISAAVPVEELHHVTAVIYKNRAVAAVIRYGGVQFQWIWRSFTGIERSGAKPRCTRAGPTLLCSSCSLFFWGGGLGIQTHSQMSFRSFGQWVTQTDRSEKPKWPDCQHPPRGEEVTFTHRADGRLQPDSKPTAEPHFNLLQLHMFLVFFFSKVSAAQASHLRHTQVNCWGKLDGYH